MGSPTKTELEVLITIAKECNYVLETGSGYSTICFAVNDVKVVSIDLLGIPDKMKSGSPGVIFLTGWSIADSDMIKFGHPLFIESKHKDIPDQSVAFGNSDMAGKTDLIRKAISEYGVPEFFFCDTGEYCGHAEWVIMKDVIPVGGFIALHDINYPRSIKNFRAYKEIISNYRKWELIYRSVTKAGMCVVRRLV